MVSPLFVLEKEISPGTLKSILADMSAKRYPVIIEQTGTGNSAYSPDVDGCAAAVDTQEETRRRFQDALAAHFEVPDFGGPIPEPHSSVDYVEVA
jgi:predicted RNase H-like HicB family nuclease